MASSRLGGRRWCKQLVVWQRFLKICLSVVKPSIAIPSVSQVLWHIETKLQRLHHVRGSGGSMVYSTTSPEVAVYRK